MGLLIKEVSFFKATNAVGQIGWRIPETNSWSWGHTAAARAAGQRLGYQRGSVQETAWEDGRPGEESPDRNAGDAVSTWPGSAQP